MPAHILILLLIYPFFVLLRDTHTSTITITISQMQIKDGRMKCRTFRFCMKLRIEHSAFSLFLASPYFFMPYHPVIQLYGKVMTDNVVYIETHLT